MTLSTEQHALLDQPLTRDQIATRAVGKGRQAAYLEGFEAIRQANRAFGHGGWGMTVDNLQFHAMTSGGFYRATVTVTVTGCEPQQDVGGCVAQNDTAEQHDMAFKGAVTDAMKRALRHYGAAFGNDLYSDDAPVAPAAQQQTARAQTPPARRPAPVIHEPTGQQTRPALRTANTATEEDYAAVTALLRADTEGAEKLPKPPGQMTPEELRKTRDWLDRRARAIKKGQTVWVDPGNLPAGLYRVRLAADDIGAAVDPNGAHIVEKAVDEARALLATITASGDKRPHAGDYDQMRTLLLCIQRADPWTGDADPDAIAPVELLPYMRARLAGYETAEVAV